MIVTIDGASGIGKTTTAKLLCRELGFTHLVGGTFFRSLTFRCLKEGVSRTDDVLDIAREISPTINTTDGQSEIFLDGVNVTDQLWTNTVNDNVPEIANIPEIRVIRTNWLRNFAKKHESIIADGRTLGTEVFPQADHKFYLICDLLKRTEHLSDQLHVASNLAEEISKNSERDAKDKLSKVDKFRVAEDAHVLDVTQLSPVEVLTKIVDVMSGEQHRL